MPRSCWGTWRSLRSLTVRLSWASATACSPAGTSIPRLLPTGCLPCCTRLGFLLGRNMMPLMMQKTVGGFAGGWRLSAASSSLTSSWTVTGIIMLTSSGIGPFLRDLLLFDRWRRFFVPYNIYMYVVYIRHFLLGFLGYTYHI